MKKDSVKRSLFTLQFTVVAGTDPRQINQHNLHMGITEDTMNKGWYMHADYDESQMLKGRIKAAIAKHANDDDLSAT